MSSQLVLFGAGHTGKWALRNLLSQGLQAVAFADNDPKKQGTLIDGLKCYSVEDARVLYPDASWVVTVLSRPAAKDMRQQVKDIGVATKPLYEVLPVCHELPPAGAISPVAAKCFDDKNGAHSLIEFFDQLSFRRHPDYDLQLPPSDCKDIYFPDFIVHRDDEHFVDCGAADGDTVKAFVERWEAFRYITAFEPDEYNFKKLCETISLRARLNFQPIESAVCDRSGKASFVANGDYSSHLGGIAKSATFTTVEQIALDWAPFHCPPTYIKMDIEGSELEALWGARKILKEHSPVLAICAYHTSDHLWQIPLLIHAIQPAYKLFLRRYAEGAFELVWYAVPPERVK
jgi:FkbM family methyltransferase